MLEPWNLFVCACVCVCGGGGGGGGGGVRGRGGGGGGGWGGGGGSVGGGRAPLRTRRSPSCAWREMCVREQVEVSEIEMAGNKCEIRSW